MNNYQAIKFWAEMDRPRERFEQYGKTHVSEAELLAIIIQTGFKNQSALELSKQVLQSFNNSLVHLARTSIDELCKIKGIGKSKAIAIHAAIELGKRRYNQNEENNSKISSSQQAFQVLRSDLDDLSIETFCVLYLNKANEFIKKELVSKGGLSSTLVDQRVIFKRALELKATALILAHNHPSGQLKPSEADIKLTKTIKTNGELLEINILDHLIVTSNNYFSFADEGIM